MNDHLGKKTTCLAGLLAVGLVVFTNPLIGFAQDVNAQTAEAQAFFQRVANQSTNPLIAALAQESLTRLQQKNKPTRQVVVPLMEQPDTSLVVPILVNGNVMATFMVDTGSSYTVITPALARKLGVVVTPQTPRVSLITGNGVVEAPMVTLHDVTVGSVRVAEVTAVVQQLGNGDDILLSGLLGMNFFKGMDLTVRGDNLVIGVPGADPAGR